MKCGPDPDPDICLTCGQQWPCRWADKGGHVRNVPSVAVTYPSPYTSGAYSSGAYLRTGLPPAPDDREAAHRCPAPGRDPGAVAFCEVCGTARRRMTSGLVQTVDISAVEVAGFGSAEPRYIPGGHPSWVLDPEAADVETLRGLLREARHQVIVLSEGHGMISADVARKQADAARREAESRYLELSRMYAATADELYRLRALADPPDPEPGSVAWWQQATAEDLEPGPAECPSCGLTVPVPEPDTRLCRFCSDEQAGIGEEIRAGMVVTPARPPLVVAALVRMWLAAALGLGSFVMIGWVVSAIIWAVS